MSEISAAMHAHKQEIMTTFTEHVTAIIEGLPQADPDALVGFLQGDLLPHAIGEEQHFYPAMDPVLRAHGRPTSTMTVDHEFIEEYIRRIRETTAALRSADSADRAVIETRLRRLCLQLEALLQLHLEKEERIYMPLFERHVPQEEQQRVLAAMDEATAVERLARAPDTLDLRTLLPVQRRQLIGDAFEALAPGESFVLVSDHDMRPLYYEWQAEWPGAFTWVDLDDGPRVWRVRLGRPGAVDSGIDPEQIILVR
jgi:uncharacterized protein (DUF2249 family)/hemerythrin-like domain-containing protein